MIFIIAISTLSLTITLLTGTILLTSYINVLEYIALMVTLLFIVTLTYLIFTQITLNQTTAIKIKIFCANIIIIFSTTLFLNTLYKNLNNGYSPFENTINKNHNKYKDLNSLRTEIILDLRFRTIEELITLDKEEKEELKELNIVTLEDYYKYNLEYYKHHDQIRFEISEPDLNNIREEIPESEYKLIHTITQNRPDLKFKLKKPLEDKKINIQEYLKFIYDANKYIDKRLEMHELETIKEKNFYKYEILKDL